VVMLLYPAPSNCQSATTLPAGNYRAQLGNQFFSRLSGFLPSLAAQHSGPCLWPPQVAHLFSFVSASALLCPLSAPLSQRSLFLAAFSRAFLFLKSVRAL
jgi:hypothetical protein